MFINSTDAAQQAAKDALNAVIAAAQDNFAAASRRLGVDRANFFKIIAARHNIDQASTRRLRLNMTDALFIIDSKPTTAPPNAATDINANGIPAEVLEFMKGAAAKEATPVGAVSLPAALSEAATKGLLHPGIPELIGITESILGELPASDISLGNISEAKINSMGDDMLARMQLETKEAAMRFLEDLLDNSVKPKDLVQKYQDPIALIFVSSAKGLILVQSQDFPPDMLLNALRNPQDKKILVGFLTHYMQALPTALHVATELSDKQNKEASAVLKAFLMKVLDIAMPD